MIALHGGYKANIKAAHMAAHHFKGCGERGGRGSVAGPLWPPVAGLLWAGNRDQSRVGRPSGRAAALIFGGKTFLLPMV